MCEECEKDPWYADIKAFVKKYPEASYGPAHVVFDDFNTDLACVEHCLYEAKQIQHFIDNRIWSHGYIEEPLENSQQLYSLYFSVHDMREEIKATVEFLERMVKEDRHQERH